MNEQLRQICEQIEALPDDRRTDVFLYAFTGGEVSQQIRIDHLKALASHALRVEKMLEAATVIETKDWSIANNGNPEGLIALRQFDSNGNMLSYTHHHTALEAFEATQDDSNGSEVQG